MSEVQYAFSSQMCGKKELCDLQVPGYLALEYATGISLGVQSWLLKMS